jgi:hypothetical protein
LQAACWYHNRTRDTIDEYNMAVCGDRAHGHLSSTPKRATTSRLRVRTEPRSNMRAGMPSEMGAEGLAQYSRRIMSLASWVQYGRPAAIDVAVVDAVVEPLCPLMHVSPSDEAALRAAGLPKPSNGNHV